MNTLSQPIIASSLRHHSNVVDPVPPDWYEVYVLSADLKGSSDGLRQWIAICYAVEDGEYAGAKIFSRISLKGAEARGLEIGECTLSVLLADLKLQRLDSVDQLLGAKALIRVSIKDDDRFYKRNEVNFVRHRLPSGFLQIQAHSDLEVNPPRERKGWISRVLSPNLTARS